MLVTSNADTASVGELCPSPIKANDDSVQTLTQQIGSSSLLMHTSFGVHRHNSDDLSSTSFTTTTFRPRRSMSSNSGQQQTRHIVCRSEVSTNPTDLNLTQDKDPFDDEHDAEADEAEAEEENTDELNLAVMVANEDAQSLRGFVSEPTAPENTSLDEAFIDETELERAAQNLSSSENQNNGERSIEELTKKTPQIPVLTERSLNHEENLDEILRRNESRPIRLTDSDVSIRNVHKAIPHKKMLD